MKKLVLISSLFVFIACKTVEVTTSSNREIKAEQLLKLIKNHNITEVAIYLSCENDEWEPVNYLYNHSLKLDQSAIHFTNAKANITYTYDRNKLVNYSKSGHSMSFYFR